MTREWRHLRMLKRAGRAHADGRRDTTSTGELALLCAACPHPGINMTLDWETIPVKDR